MGVSKERWSYSFALGNDTEDRFQAIMLSRGNTCEKSNRNDDIYKHIDFYVNGKGIDVKGNRKKDTIWVELKNVNGKKGWLQGEAEFIAFDMVDVKSFYIFSREDLYSIVKDITEYCDKGGEYMKLYSRRSRKDIIVRLKYDHIKHLKHQKLDYE